MSDRPMRLKYLTKMKIILCIFLLYITAVSVFGEPQELNGIVGEIVKFPAAVNIDGNLRYSSVTIGDVTSGRFTPLRNVEYSDRVHWDSSTGLFSLSGLRMEDSGVYTMQNTQQNINTTFQLNVYKDNVPVSKPHVSITRNEYPCTIECTAEKGTGVTLSWYREGEEEPYVSSRVASAPYLHLPKTVERSDTYTCEAKNSVSNEKASITVEAHCTAPAGSSTGEFFLNLLIAALFFALIVVLIYFRCRPSARSSAGTIFFASFLVVALIVVLIILVCRPPSTGTVVLVFFLVVALIVVLVDLLCCSPTAVRQLILGETTPELPAHDTKSELEAVRTIILDIRSVHPDIRSGNPAVRQLILDVKTLLDTLVELAPDDDEQAFIHNVQ